MRHPDADPMRELENRYTLPPQNLEAERCVLGAVLCDNGALYEVREQLTADDFYQMSHRQILRAMMDLGDKREAIDLITLSDTLAADDHLETVGGSVGLAELADFMPSAANIGSYISIVREQAMRREVLKAARQAQAEIHESTDDAETIRARLTSRLIRQEGQEGGFEHISDVAGQTLKEIERASEGTVGIPTGLRAIDITLGGIPRGELWIPAGRPSMGKTALAVSIARGAAERGYGVAFVTVESPSPKLVLRMLGERVGIENRDLRRGKIEELDYPRVVAAAGAIGQLPIWLLDRERSWERIKLKVRALKLRHPEIGLVVVDYIGLLSVSGAKERYLQLGIVSSEAKAMASQLDVGVMLLSQLNREVEKQADKRPRLSDLRESGNLEQDADVVGLLFREHYYNDKAHPELAEFDIAKCRDGDTGVIKLRFQRNTTSFSDW